MTDLTWFLTFLWSSMIVYASAQMIRQRRVSEKNLGLIAGGIGAALIVADDFFHLSGQTSKLVIWAGIIFLFICVVGVDGWVGKARTKLASYARRNQLPQSPEQAPDDTSFDTEGAHSFKEPLPAWTISDKRGPPGELREWHWRAGIKGGDYFFHAKFPVSDNPRLATTLREHVPTGFRLWSNAKGPTSDAIPDAGDFYFDEQNYDDLIAAHERRLSRNLYRYTEIGVCGSELKIVAGYGGAGPPLAGSKTLLLIAQSPELSLLEWSVKYDGGEYMETAATGKTAAELVTYLTDPTPADYYETVLDMFTLSSKE